MRRGRPRYEFARLLLGRGARILHLHFFDELTQRRGAFQTLLRSLLFLAVLAAVTGVLLARPRHTAPAFVDAAIVATPPPPVVPPADPAPLPDATEGAAPLPSLVPSPARRRADKQKPE